MLAFGESEDKLSSIFLIMKDEAGLSAFLCLILKIAYSP
jgi:hypothetical protein